MNIYTSQVFAGCVAVMDIFGSITRVRVYLEKQLDNPIAYFMLLWTLSGTMMHIAFYFVCWTKQHHIAKAIEIFRKSFSNSYNFTRLPCVRIMHYIL